MVKSFEENYFDELKFRIMLLGILMLFMINLIYNSERFIAFLLTLCTAWLGKVNWDTSISEIRRLRNSCLSYGFIIGYKGISNSSLYIFGLVFPIFSADSIHLLYPPID